MNDHIDPDKVRELAKLHRKWGEEAAWAPKIKNTHTQIAEILESLLPTPPLSTLKDLIEEGHDPAQYQWVQAEHRDKRCIIVRMDGHTSQPTVSLLTATGATIWASTDEVIPLPDKPRLVWPASEPEPAEETPDDLPDHVKETPEPQPGEAWLIEVDPGDIRIALLNEDDDGELTWFTSNGDGFYHSCPVLQRLVPEVAPKVLITEEDYENAQYGTICAEDGHFPLYTSTWTWHTIGGDSHDHRDLAGTPRRILRWGLGEQA